MGIEQLKNFTWKFSKTLTMENNDEYTSGYYGYEKSNPMKPGQPGQLAIYFTMHTGEDTLTSNGMPFYGVTIESTSKRNKFTKKDIDFKSERELDAFAKKIGISEMIRWYHNRSESDAIYTSKVRS
jgi:hypothetical protein